MKTQLLLFSLITSIFSTQIQAQDRTIVNAQNSEISDNLDLRAVASVFGDSQNLSDFERRLNDPKLQISNLDLNNDGQVDYLRVIESVQNYTHIIFIQAVLSSDVYQDVATIEVEKDWNNNVQVQVVGNSYFYGSNYIYEPVYYNTPLIYASFWINNYYPYYSNWSWNYYPSYYYTRNTYPVYRYRHNVNISLNTYNHYNYVNYRRSNYAANVYYSIRSNGFEKQHPEYSFSRRNTRVNNRYELDQIRNTRNSGTRNEIGYSQNRTISPIGVGTQRTVNQRDYTQNRIQSTRETTPQRTVTQRDYSQNRSQSTRETTPQRTVTQRDYSQNRSQSARENPLQGSQTQRDYSQNRSQSARENPLQGSQTQRDYSQNRTESSNENSSARNSSSEENTNNSRNGHR